MLKSVSLISFSIGLLGMAATPVQASLRQYHSTVESLVQCSLSQRRAVTKWSELGSGALTGLGSKDAAPAQLFQPEPEACRGGSLTEG